MNEVNANEETMMKTAKPALTARHLNESDEGDRLEIEGGFFRAVVMVSPGLWPTVELRSFIHTSGQEVPIKAERAAIRRAALRWVKESR